MNKKIAIVTGASRGVGRAIALHLAKNNYSLVLLARNAKALSLVQKQILDDGGNASYMAINVSDGSKVEHAIKEIIAQHGRIDLLFNNAAILTRGTTNIADEDIKNLLEINLAGAIYVAKHVANQMKLQRSGYIINVSSSAGNSALSFSGIYSASKFGLCGFSEALFKEMASYNVKVTSICPSMIATDMAAGRKFNGDQIIQLKDLVKTVDYLLSLSTNATPAEITLSCLPLVAKMTEATYELYLK